MAQQPAASSPTASSRGATMHTKVVKLDELTLDDNIVYTGRDPACTPYTYVERIIDMNRDGLQRAHKLASIRLSGHTVILQASNTKSIEDATERLISMLREPVYTLLVNVKHVVALRVLKDVKKDFSASTGCWLHFIWIARTVACYGINHDGAKEYLNGVCERVQACAVPGGFNGILVVERSYPRVFKNVVKKYVDYIERVSGSKIVIQREDPRKDEIVLQMYGSQENIDSAHHVMESQIFTRPASEHSRPGIFPATAISPDDSQRRRGGTNGLKSSGGLPKASQSWRTNTSAGSLSSAESHDIWADRASQDTSEHYSPLASASSWPPPGRHHSQAVPPAQIRTTSHHQHHANANHNTTANATALAAQLAASGLDARSLSLSLLNLMGKHIPPTLQAATSFAQVVSNLVPREDEHNQHDPHAHAAHSSQHAQQHGQHNQHHQAQHQQKKHQHNNHQSQQQQHSQSNHNNSSSMLQWLQGQQASSGSDFLSHAMQGVSAPELRPQGSAPAHSLQHSATIAAFNHSIANRRESGSVSRRQALRELEQYVQQSPNSENWVLDLLGVMHNLCVHPAELASFMQVRSAASMPTLSAATRQQTLNDLIPLDRHAQSSPDLWHALFLNQQNAGQQQQRATAQQQQQQQQHGRTRGGSFDEGVAAAVAAFRFGSPARDSGETRYGEPPLISIASTGALPIARTTSGRSGRSRGEELDLGDQDSDHDSDVMPATHADIDFGVL